MPLPTGYIDMRTKSKWDIRYYIRKVGPEPWASVMVALRPLKKKLPQPVDGPSPVDLLPLQPYFSKGFRTTFVKQSWRNFTLGTFEVRGEIDGLSNVGEATIIPFESGAVELYVSAPEPHEKDAKQDFLTVLGAARGETNWISADVRRKAQLANGIMWAGYGLALLYLPCWALFFRGQFMRLHGFRTIWQIAAGILIFIPLTMSTGESGGFNLVGYFFSLALLGFAARRIKLGIEYGA